MGSSAETRHAVVACPLDAISHADALAAGRLLAEVWPRPDRGPAERADQLITMGKLPRPDGAFPPTSFVVFADSDERPEREVIAHALVFPRTIGFDAAAGAAAEIDVLALAMVATDARHRGEGLGAAVVKAAFELVDEGRFAFALYQTSFPVESFYERLGARRVTNRLVNSRWKPTSRGPSAEASPFWDDLVMRYPAGDGSAGEPWPEGDVDLRGEGY